MLQHRRRRQVRRVAALLAEGPVGAFALGKQAFNQAILHNLKEVLDAEGLLQDIAGNSPEHWESVTAFLEKRQPRFE